jgi:hypothetical protein
MPKNPCSATDKCGVGIQCEFCAGMEFDLSQTSQRETYHLLIGLVTPRPIALITSLDREGRVNAAPFSAYNCLGTDPAIVAIDGYAP